MDGEGDPKDTHPRPASPAGVAHTTSRLPDAGTAIASLAMLKVNSGEGHDYIDGFVPFAAECVRTSASGRVSLDELERCFAAEYGFSVPLPALKTILHRAAPLTRRSLAARGPSFGRCSEGLAYLRSPWTITSERCFG